MRVTTWYFLRSRPGELQPLSMAMMQRFVAGDCKLPPDDDGVVRCIEVTVRCEGRQALEVVRVNAFQDRVHPDGTFDQERQFQIVAMAGEARFGRSSPPTQADGVIDAEHLFTRRRVDHLLHWKPSAAELAVLAELVNRKARRQLM